MRMIFKSAWAMARRKKLQNLLIGLIMMLIATLLFIGLSMSHQSNTFEVMFDRARASQSLVILSKSANDVDRSAAWWEARDEVAATIQYDALMMNVEYMLDGNKESELVMLTAFIPDSEIDRMYETPDRLAVQPTGNEVLLNYNYAKGRSLDRGDTLHFSYKGHDYALTVAGFLVDPQFSNPFVTPSRGFVSEDFFTANGIESDTALLGIRYDDITTVDDAALMTLYSEEMDEKSQPNTVTYSTLETSYLIIGNIIASALLAVSILIFLIVIFVINTTVRNTILQQYKQIGVKKVLGYTNRQIQGSLLWVHGINALIAATAGAFLGVPIRNLMNQGLNDDIQVGTDAGLDLDVLLTIVIVFGLVVVFTTLASKRASNVKPVQAIKYGMPERKTSRSRFSLTEGPGIPISLLIAFKQITVNKRKAVTTACIIALLIYVAMVIQNTGSTLGQPVYFSNHLLGLEIGDFTTVAPSESHVGDVLEKLRSIDDVEDVVYYDYSLTDSTEDIAGNNIYIGGQVLYGDYPDQGVLLTEGRQPLNATEIILSNEVAQKTGKRLGDYITIDKETGSVTYLVSGLYNSVTFNGSNYILMVDEVPSDLVQGNGFYWVYSASPEVVIEDMDRTVKDLLGNGATVSRYDSNIKNILSTVETFPLVINTLSIVFLSVCAVIILNFTMMDINHSTRVYGIMKATGFSNGQIKRILLIRSLLLTGIGTLFGGVASVLTVNRVMHGIFSLTPFSSIELPVLFDSLGSLVLILLFFLVTMVGTLIPARRVESISPKQLIAE